MKKEDRNSDSTVSRRNFLKLASAGIGLPFLTHDSESVYLKHEQPGELYLPVKNFHSRWTSSENKRGLKGMGGRENKGAKGHAFDRIKAGDSFTLLDVKGSGIVNRIKMTTDDRSPYMMRSLRIDMYWDEADKPAVSAPLGDFFGIGLGRLTSFDNAVFSDPEGRSFDCFVPMAFRKGARITITNESDKDLHHIFYNVNYELKQKWNREILYFHGYWNRENPTKLGKDFEILPRVKGQGRFLGTNIGVRANPVYGDLWWGEGEVRMYLNGDRQWPTLVGTGTEDYIGTAWGMGKFINRYQGCLIADTDKKEWAFYRYHLPDPVFFDTDLKVCIQQIGGGPKKQVANLYDKGVPMKLISVDAKNKFWKLLDMKNPPGIHDKDFPEGWVNFYRIDDWSAMAYFYLDKPVNDLPPLAPPAARVKDLS